MYLNFTFNTQGQVVQSIVNLTSFLMTNSLIVVAKEFLVKLIFLLQKLLSFLQQKISMYLPYFKTEIFNFTLAHNFVKF